MNQIQPDSRLKIIDGAYKGYYATALGMDMIEPEKTRVKIDDIPWSEIVMRNDYIKVL